MILDVRRLTRNKRAKGFFQRSAPDVAKSILGDCIVIRHKDLFLAGKIVEVESYLGIKDDASHAFGEKFTERTKTMYLCGGVVYVYLIYGKYWCFNIVVSKKGDPQTVFIRALEPLVGIDIMKKNRGVQDIKKLTNGPCRWTQSFGVNKSYLSRSIISKDLFISSPYHKPFAIVKTRRVGVDYAIRSKGSLLRFYIKDNPFVSKR